MADYDEYEVIPTSPLRKLEQRIARVESTSSSSEIRRLVDQIIELIKANQKVIDDVIKADTELRNEISKIPPKIDQLLESMGDFMELLKTSAAEETVSEISKDVMEPVVEKLDELITHTKKSTDVNQAALASLDTIDKRLKRLHTHLAVAQSGRRTYPPQTYQPPTA